MARVRIVLPIISDFFRARAFLRNPLRYVGRRLFRFGLSFGIFGISVGLGGLRFGIRLPFISFLFGGRKRGGKGRGKKGGGTKGGGAKGGGAKGGGTKGGGEKGGGTKGGGAEAGGSTKGDGTQGSSRPRTQRIRESLEGRKASLKESLKRSRDNEKAENSATKQELKASRSKQTSAGNSNSSLTADPKQKKKKGRSQDSSQPGGVRPERRDTQPLTVSEPQAQEKVSSDQSDRRNESGSKAKASTNKREGSPPQVKTETDVDRAASTEKSKKIEGQKPSSASGGQDSQRPTSIKTSSEEVEDTILSRPPEIVVPGSPSTDFDINNPLPIGCRVLLEASAGTGKTFSLTSLVARYVAEKDLKIDQLLMVTFTKAAASEMRERTRGKLSEALAALQSNKEIGSLSKNAQWAKQIVSCDEVERQLRIVRLRDAISNIDSAMITTIHGFFQQALREVGLRSIDTAMSEIAEADKSISRQILRDDLVRQFAEGDVPLMASMPKKNANDLETQIHEVLRALESNISAIAAPWKEDGTSAFQWSSYVSKIKQQIQDVRRESGQMTFDDLISGLRDLLEPENELRSEIINDLRQRYRLVLIDEFQDTDDTQWSVFSQIFESQFIRESAQAHDEKSSFLAMILVGDPKQAIYRFRGADIAAYLRVSSDPDLIRFEMKRNFRSDRNLLVGLNRWFGGLPDENGKPTGFKFGHSQIGFIQVDAANDGDGSSLRIEGSAESASPLQLRWIPTDSKPAPVVGQLRPRIAEDLANHVVTLLNDGTLPDGDGGRRQVLPSDISILVRNHNDAQPLVEALRSRNIAVVKSSIGSVLESDAVHQLQVLLLGMAHPNDSRRVKAAGLSWFFNLDFEELLDERRIVNLGLRLNKWADLLLEKGIVDLFQSLKNEADVVLEISKSPEFERRLTDLEHIVELLHREVGGRKLPASSLVQYLIDMKNVETVSDVAVRRIDTDAKAIQITTMHASKGLEYPIVLIPYPKGLPTKGWSTAKSPNVFSYKGYRYVDSAPRNDWTLDDLSPMTRDALALDEIQGDDLRLMYVAFTRAKHQLVVWWAKSKGVEKGPLARLLFGNHEDITEQTKPLDGELARRSFDDLKLKIGVDEKGIPLMEVRELDLDSVEALYPKDRDIETFEKGSISTFPFNAKERFGWGRWSYSTIVKAVKSETIDVARGGLDENHDSERGSIEIVESLKLHPAGDLFDMPASSEFGTLVHEVLENVKFESPTLREDLHNVLNYRASSVLRDVEIPTLVDGLIDSLHTPLEPVIPGFEIGDLHSRDRLAEMDFHFSLNGGPVSTAEVARIAARDSESMFAPYFAKLSQALYDWGDRRIDGILTGSIDVLFRVDDERATKYFVADWKSNRLHKAGLPVYEASYGFESMKNAMEANHYPLQAIVYCVALHRFLESRLESYDIDDHLGGALYLFIRGMVGPETPLINGVRNGVFAWRPKSETILEISSLLSDGRLT